MPRRPRLLACAPFASICFALFALPAQAAPRPASESAQSASDEKRALQLFEESEAVYQEGRFGDAAALLEEAYSLHPEPTLLYNLARARESQGELSKAADAYERYLAGAPEAADRGAIEHRVRTLRERDTKQQALEAERQAAEAKLAALQQQNERNGGGEGAEPADQSVLAGPLPWVIFGLGAAGVGAGVVVGLLAESRHQDAVEEPGQAEAQRLQEGAEGLALGATIAYVAGGTLAGAGVILGIVGLTGGEDHSADEPTPDGTRAGGRPSAQGSVQLQVGPGSLFVTGRF